MPMSRRPPGCARRLGSALLAGLLLGGWLTGCAGRPTSPAAGPATDARVTPLPGSLVATYAEGTLLLSIGRRGGAVEAVARWPVEDVPPGSHEYRAARLELLDAAAARDLRLAAAQPVTIHGTAEWTGVVREVMTGLAPQAPGEAALTRVQGQDVVFYLAADGALRLHRHEDKPAERRVTRIVGEGEFAARADAVLRARYAGQPVLLFASDGRPGDESFVFFDLPRRQSVLVLGTSLGPAGGFIGLMRLLARVPDTMIVRGQVLGLLTRPVSSLGRLAWLVSQTALELVPPRFVGRDVEPPPLAPQPPLDAEAWERELDAMGLPPRYRGTLTPLIDGDAFFTDLVQALQEARTSIDVRLFIFDNDDYAIRIADLLKHRSREVRVRVLVDALGTLGAGQGAPEGAATGPRVRSIASYLRAGSDVQVREVPNPWLVADHTKVILVDSQRAYVGGMNIGHEYRYDWHDMMVALEGPIAGRLQHDFDVAWAYAGPGGDLAFARAAGRRDDAAAAPGRPGDVEVRPLYTRTLDPQVLRAQRAAMRRAQSAIWIEQPYVSDDSLISAMIEARGRGVDVRLIVPTRGDSRFMNSANLLAASVLMRSGVRVYVYPGMTHVKAALYDGWACLGSANFDKLSLRVNQETNVATSDPVFVARVRRELFEADFARSVELVEPPVAGWGTYLTAYVAAQL